MPKKLSPKQSDIELLERLNRHPEMKERFLAILALAENKSAEVGTADEVEALQVLIPVVIEQTEVGTADEVEALLVEEVRKLGGQSLGDWARSAHQRIAAEVKKQDPTSYCGKKNA